MLLKTQSWSDDQAVRDNTEGSSLNRRNFCSTRSCVGIGALALKQMPGVIYPEAVHADQKLATVPSKYTVNEPQTPFAKATTYNNHAFDEFGTDKSEPAKNAHTLKTRPWTVQVAGLVKKPQTIDIDTIMKYRPLEERVYRHRCVEAWSMVIPWVILMSESYPSMLEPLPSAKYVKSFRLGQQNMPDKAGGYDWPYPRAAA